MKKHFVRFFSPGTFVAEMQEQEVPAWDVDIAVELAETITERHGAIPYGFVFLTRERGQEDLDSHITETSPMHYLPHCRVETIEDVENRDDPDEEILLDNMRANGWNRIVTTTKGWKWNQPLREDDIVLIAKDHTD